MVHLFEYVYRCQQPTEWAWGGDQLGGGAGGGGGVAEFAEPRVAYSTLSNTRCLSHLHITLLVCTTACKAALLACVHSLATC